MTGEQNGSAVVLSDGLGTLHTWDAKRRLAAAGGATYTYDALGQRASKSGVSLAWTPDTVYFGGQPIARYAGGQWTDLNYGPTGLLAEVPGTQTGAPVYRVTDHLGSTVGSLLADGSFVNPMDYTPFGQVFAGSTSDPYKFAGYERDAESGLDYASARQYASNIGRFISPDPSGLAFADPTSPQSFNLYSYAANNPMRNVDPSGLSYCQWDDGTHDDSAGNSGDGNVQKGSDCTDAGGTWKHDDGLNDDGSTAGSEDPPFLTVDTSLDTQDGSTSMSTSGPAYDPDGANIYNFSVGITLDSKHSVSCIAQAYGVAGAGNATAITVGRPTVAKRFAGWGYSQGTSRLSKTLSKAANSTIAKKLGVEPGSYPSPTGGLMADGQPFVMGTTSNLGRAAARWTPWFISAAATLYSSIQLGICLGR